MKSFYVNRRKQIGRFALRIFLCATLCSTGFYGHTQSGYIYYDIDEITSKELIKSVRKDAHGYLWLATDKGVVRYDGVESALFAKELPTPYAKTFIKRRSGQFLVLHDYGIKEIVSAPDTVYFKPFLVNDSAVAESLNYPKSIYEDQSEALWIGEFNSVARIDGDGLKRFELGEAFQSINYHRSFAFAEDAFGALWIAPYKGPLLTYDKASDTLKPVALKRPATNPTCLLTVKGDHLLIGGSDGLSKIKIDSDKNILQEKFIGQLTGISCIAAIDNENIYVGTWTNGLYRFDFEEEIFTEVKEASFSDILDFYLDPAENELWFSGSENIGLFKKAPVKRITAAGINRVESISVGEKEDIYYSTGEKIFRLHHGPGGYEAEELYESKTTFFDRILAEGDQLWIGDAFGSIARFDLEARELITLQGATNQAVQHIFKDSHGNKWFSGNSRGVTRINPAGQIKIYEEAPNIAAVNESAHGRLIAISGGKKTLMYEYVADSDKFVPIRLSYTFEASPAIQAEDIAFDDSDNIWLATDEGLVNIKYDDGRYRSADRIFVDGLGESEPFRAVAVSGNTVWAAAPNGLALLANGRAAVYTLENGLPSAILKERGLLVYRGKALISTAKGIAEVDAHVDKIGKTPAPVFRSLAVNNKKGRLISGAKNSFPFNSRIHADYILLSFPVANTLYQSRIIGMDTAWSAPSANRNISFFGLPQGSYTLEIRAKKNGYLWSDPLQYSFTIENPWFRRWWAYLIFAGALALFTSVSVKLYNKRLIRQKKKLQKIIEARTEEINRQKNEIIDQKNKIILQKEELLAKNKAVYESQHALSEADLKYLHLKEKQLQDQIEFKNKQITTHTLNIIQKNATLKDLREKLESIVKLPNGSVQHELKKTMKMIDESFRLDKDWEEFRLYFEQVYTGFYAKLKINYPDLTAQELRHCALIRLNLSIAECASILGISPDSVKVSRTRLRKKLKLPQNQNLADFIMGI